MRNKFDEQLSQLNHEMIEMGALCEEVIALASRALTENDKSLAARVAPLDSEIDRKERDIENLCLKLLLQQQPVARDLRQISAALKMITDMERIGDQAEDIAEIISFLHGHQAEDNDLLREMAKAAIRMVTESVDAYVKCDTMLAEQVIAEDDTVDGYFTQVKERLIGKIAQVYYHKAYGQTYLGSGESHTLGVFEGFIHVGYELLQLGIFGGYVFCHLAQNGFAIYING